VSLPDDKSNHHETDVIGSNAIVTIKNKNKNGGVKSQV
jgi:hypothetical protein